MRMEKFSDRRDSQASASLRSQDTKGSFFTNVHQCTSLTTASTCHDVIQAHNTLSGGLNKNSQPPNCIV